MLAASAGSGGAVAPGGLGAGVADSDDVVDGCAGDEDGGQGDHRGEPIGAGGEVGALRTAVVGLPLPPPDQQREYGDRDRGEDRGVAEFRVPVDEAVRPDVV